MNIGLIAGNGQFPIIFAKAAKAKGLSVYAAAHINEATTEANPTLRLMLRD